MECGGSPDQSGDTAFGNHEIHEPHEKNSDKLSVEFIQSKVSFAHAKVAKAAKGNLNPALQNCPGMMRLFLIRKI